MRGEPDKETTGAADAATESAVLHRVLDLHPAQPTIGELLGDLCGERPGFAERDAVERAIRELLAAGLLRRNGELILATRAALRFSELADR